MIYKEKGTYPGMYLSTRPLHFKVCKDKLVKKSAHPPDMYDFPQTTNYDIPIQDWCHSSQDE